ncbi:hypothetical protein [Mesorhizobium waimense]|uniref:hypothetical protein n=1 Tax=Mesorhizobium waimense TaxID=1300307 RepID=UPI0011C48287|nr:hypothetical protein [Mesorhizobium waimense]
MARFLASLLAAMLVASAGRCWSKDTSKQISEDALRMISAEMYSGILSQECVHGRRYKQSRIENGFKRHLEEMRLQLVADGYTIVPDVTDNNARFSLSEMAFDAKRRLGMPRQLGCRDAYWLDDNPEW